MTRPTSCVLLLAALTLATGVTFAGEKYDVDTAHSYIGFSVRHMSVANVRGEFKDFSADFTVDEADLANSSIELRIAAASIDTDHEQRDEHLRSPDFLDVASHSEIVFKSGQIEKTSDGRYRAEGDLTIRGVTRDVVLDLEVAGPVKDPWGNLRIGLDGGVTVNRKDYGVSWSRLMDNGGLVVGDDVKISFSLEAARKVG